MVGSPECTMFSALQSLSSWTTDTQKRWVEGKVHFAFCMQLNKQQVQAGRLLLHEHPSGASSWKLPEVKALMRMNGVRTVKVLTNVCLDSLRPLHMVGHPHPHGSQQRS